MRVLHVITDTNIGGAGRYLINLLMQPAFEDVCVYVVCPDGKLGERLDRLEINRVSISGRDVSFSLRLIPEIFKIIRKVKPNVVHTHSSLSGRIAARLLRVPVVYTKHGLVRIPSSDGVRPPVAGSVRRFFNFAVARVLSNKIIGISQAVSKELLESGIPEHLVTTIHNGIDVSAFECGQQVKHRGPAIGTLARLHPSKGIDILIEAAKMVVASEPKARFLIGGTGPIEDRLIKTVKELKLEPYVKMLGFVRDVPGFLTNLDLFVLPSKYEGLGLVLLEAMAAGLPVVATQVGGVPEAVVNQQTGILVPPGQSKHLAQAIMRLIVDKELAGTMGAAGRKRAEELFDAGIMAEKTLEVYKEVVGADKCVSK